MRPVKVVTGDMKSSKSSGMPPAAPFSWSTSILTPSRERSRSSQVVPKRAKRSAWVTASTSKRPSSAPLNTRSSPRRLSQSQDPLSL